MRPYKHYIRDRRHAAIHEAGHVVVAERLGVEGYAHITLTDTDDIRNDKAWVGRAFFDGGMGSARTKRLICVAGAVAEHCWRYRDDECLEWEYWDGDIAAMSASDWQGAGVEPGEPDQKFINAVQKVHDYLNPVTGSLWPKLVTTARQLLVDSRRMIVRRRIAAARFSSGDKMSGRPG